MVTNRIKCSMAMIISLFSDEDDFVPMRLTESLQELGRINHKYVLTYCHKYLTKNKLQPAPRWALLTAMTLVIKDNLGHLHTRLDKKLSNLALMNMIRSEHVDHQEAASCLLVSLGARFPIEIFKHIESGCQPWTQAYFYMVLTLARLCRANVHCLVPRLKPVLRNMLPTLHGVTDGEMKWTLCVSLGLFSESIQMYLSNPEGTRKPKLEKKMFFHDISAAYDLLLNSWLPMKEPKVSRAILETVAQIIQLLPNDKLDKELPSLIPTLLLVYQETFPHVSVTRCLCSVLRTGTERNSEIPVTQMQILLITFHEQICIVMEQPQNTFSEKQLNEILCCFRVLAPAFTSQILEILRMQLAIDNEQIQLGALAVLKYLLDTVPSNMESQKDQILNCVRRSLLTGSNRVKGILAQVIYTMACHNYLEREGGKQLVEFIIQQCALPTEENEESTESEEEFCSVMAAVVTDKDLRRQCEGLLKLMVGTLPIGDVLWSYLLEFVITVKYTEAFTIVCGSSYCFGIKRLMASNTQFVLNYEDFPNLPEPRTLLMRLLIVSSSLCHGKGRGVPALGLLYLLAMDIHPATVRVWDKEFPMLCNFLEKNSEKPNLQNEWEEKLLRVVSQTLEAIADKVWITQLIAEMTHCIHTYRLYPTERAFLYKCLGRVLRLTQDKDIISKSLHQMLQSVEHNEDFERDRVAAGIGDCAVTHLDTTLTTLKVFMEFNRLCISSPFHQVDNHIMKVKSTLILCYGQIMSRCPRDLILPRIETDILHNVLALFNTKMFGLKSKVKELTLKLSLTNTVTLLAKAFQPSEEHPPYTLSRKAELLSCMQELITAEPKEILSTWVRKSAMDACAALIKLQPSLSSETEQIRICLNRVFSLPDWESSTADQSTNMDMAERQKLHTDTMASVQGLLKQCLLLDLSPDGLHSVFKTMETEIQSARDHEREKAMESTLQLVTFYLEKLQVSNKVPSHNLVRIIGCVGLQCADPSHVVREAAIKSLYGLLYIQLHLEGFPVGHQDKEVEHLKAIKGGLKQFTSQALFQTCTAVSNVLSKCIAHEQLNTLLFTVFKGLTDKHRNISCTASIVTNVLITTRGSTLADVWGTIKVLSRHLHSITEPRVRNAVTHSISILASHHLPAVLSALLTYSIPFDGYICDIWRSLLTCNALRPAKFLLNNIKSLYVDGRYCHVTDTKDSATQQSLAVLCALRDVVCEPDSGHVINILYPQLVSTLLIHLSFSVWVRFPTNFLTIPKAGNTFGPALRLNYADACHYSAEILRAVLSQGKGDDRIMREMGGWHLFVSPRKHHEGVTLLASTLTACAAPHLISIVEQLTPCLVNIGESQRITIAAFFGELLNHSVVWDLLLMDTLLESLFRCLLDESPIVQWLAVQGLGNAAIGASQRIDTYCTKLLSTMLSVIDQKSKPENLIAVEAMSSMCKVLGQLQEDYTNPILGDVALAVQPYLEHQHETMRAAAFNVLGKLIRFGSVEMNPPYMEHIKSTLIRLLLHLNAESIEVTNVCKSVLNSYAPVMESANISKMFQELSSEGTTLDYDNYLSNISRHIAKDLDNQIPLYIRSCAAFLRNVLPAVRGNALTFLAFLMYNAPPHYYTSQSAAQICEQIIALLSDHEQDVRSKAAKAMRYLYMY
uniref:maestro heat-like repeat-containing protein family member 1 n=1 Tax=Pristiophorus japonicus TaxID=55135 RepID=UPI00398E33A8